MLILKIAARQGFIDDHYEGRTFSVALVKWSTLNYLDVHGLKVIRTDASIISTRPFVCCQRRLSLHFEATHWALLQWQRIDHPHRNNSGDTTDTLHYVVVERNVIGIASIAAACRRKT